MTVNKYKRPHEHPTEAGVIVLPAPDWNMMASDIWTMIEAQKGARDSLESRGLEHSLYSAYSQVMMMTLKEEEDVV